MKILTLLFTLALAVPAWAEELPHFPGWKINKIEPAESEEGVIASGPEYYGLTPPDERPPVSIDSRTARALKAGEAQPEEVYGRVAGKSGKPETASAAGDTYEYSRGNNGFVQADAISSTLPGYVAEPAEARALARGGGDSFGAGEIASYGGSSGASIAAGSSEGSSYQSHFGATPGSTAPIGESQATGSMSNSLKAAAFAASPAAAQALAKEKSKQLAANSAELEKIASSGLNVKSGFDPIETAKDKAAGKTGGKGGKSEKGGSEAGGSDRTPASEEEEVLPPCNKGRFVYDKPTHVRVKLPLGCKLILVSAWGAGGGTGMQIYQYGGGDNGPSESVQEIPGSGASFMSTTWDVDSKKYDLIVVVGDPGGAAKKKTVTVQDNSSEGGGTRTITTLEGGDGGGPDGKDGGANGGGGGGGYSGVFLAAKGTGGTTINKSQALVIGAGGDGGGGGGAGGSLSVPSTAPGARMSNQIGEKGSGWKAGFHYYSERGNAGSPGNSGKVILEYY